ncbi:hypothetical protein, partial [Dialister succinatiphilus]|uniref:hypothetical protein n=1 Tax=Dialister succinatiphilus TaxID=487173 RepID=UPI003AAE8F71
MDNHILAAIIFLMLSFLIEAVLPLQYMVWHLQMIIHYLVFSYPIQRGHWSSPFLIFSIVAES